MSKEKLDLKVENTEEKTSELKVENRELMQKLDILEIARKLISHDLRSPLASLVGVSDYLRDELKLLLDSELKLEAIKYFDAVSNDSHNILKLFNKTVYDIRKQINDSKDIPDRIKDGADEEIEKENTFLKKELSDFKLKAINLSGNLRESLGYIFKNLKNGEEIIKKIDDFEDKEEKEELVAVASSQARASIGLFDDLVDWIKVSLENDEPIFENMGLADLIEETLAPQRVAFLNKNIEIKVNADDDIKAKIDRNIFKTALRNIVSNAIKYTNEDGHIFITEDENDNSINVKIKDDGIGMSKERQESLFSQVVTSEIGTGQERGTGLGLNMIKDLADKAGMTLSVESEGKDKGTTFTISIPKNSKGQE